MVMGPPRHAQRALVELGRALRAGGYRFVTPTPETHRRVNARSENAAARTVRDIFGWSRPFPKERLPPALLALCDEAGILIPAAGPPEGDRRTVWWTSAVRYSTLSSPAGEWLFVHSAFPTEGADAVFFGPDSYRFAALLARTVLRAGRLVDVGCGTGVGGLVVARGAAEVVLADISPAALHLAAVNVALAADGGAVDPAVVRVVASDVLDGVEGEADTVIANPPYLVDAAGRLYRDGGGSQGLDLAVRIVEEGLPRLAAGGQLVLYTGTPVVDGRSALGDRLRPVLEGSGVSWIWEELDPDVFGEELERPAYREAERLAVVALVARKR